MAQECLVRQNYHEETEAGINKQINLELSTFYTYLSMSYHFDRHDLAKSGLSSFFKKFSEEELEHARKLMKLQNDRGGKIFLQEIKKPGMDDWGSPLQAMQAALDIEKDGNKALQELRDIAVKHNDAQVQDFIDANFLQEQIDTIKQLGEYITQLTKVGTGHGEWHFDHSLKS